MRHRYMMRGGPVWVNTGLSGDYFKPQKGAGHGEYHMIALAPSSVQEAIDLMQDAFDLADIYRTPVMMLADGIIGQMMEPVEFHEGKQRRELPEKEWATTGWTPESGRPRCCCQFPVYRK